MISEGSCDTDRFDHRNKLHFKIYYNSIVIVFFKMTVRDSVYNRTAFFYQINSTFAIRENHSVILNKIKVAVLHTIKKTKFLSKLSSSKMNKNIIKYSI